MEYVPNSQGLLPAVIGHNYKILCQARDSVNNVEQKTLFDLEFVFSDTMIIPTTICDSADIQLFMEYVSSGTYIAKDSLKATSTVSGASEVYLWAGQSITLLPGFNVEAGGLLNADIEDCFLLMFRNEPTAMAKAAMGYLGRKELHLNTQPNPSFGTVRLLLTVPQQSSAHFAIYDRSGNLHSEILQNDLLQQGVHEFQMELPPGMYQAVFDGGKQQVVQRIVVMEK